VYNVPCCLRLDARYGVEAATVGDRGSQEVVPGGNFVGIAQRRKLLVR
jgi:hypothetical protein